MAHIPNNEKFLCDILTKIKQNKRFDLLHIFFLDSSTKTTNKLEIDQKIITQYKND